MTWWERRILMLWFIPTMSLMFEQARTYLRLLRVIDCKNHCLTWCTFQTSKWDRPVCHAGLVNICSWLSEVCVNLGKSFTFCDENVMSKWLWIWQYYQFSNLSEIFNFAICIILRCWWNFYVYLFPLNVSWSRSIF